MEEFLRKNVFVVKEHVGLLKAANNYDVYDPETGNIIFKCREEKLGFITKILRFTDYKRNTPFNIFIKTFDDQIVVNVVRGVSFFRSRVKVLDGTGQQIGGFIQKIFSIGGAFKVLDAQENEKFYLKGKWTGWNFKFLDGERELAHVTKKWAGLGKEMLTTADNYVLSIDPSVEDLTTRKLILAAVMCIDMVLKE